MKKNKILLVMSFLLTLTACTGNPGIPYHDVFNDNRPGFQTETFESPALTQATKQAVRDLTASRGAFSRSKDKVLVSLFSDNTDYTKTRAMGRAAAKELAKQLDGVSGAESSVFRMTDAMMRPLSNGYMSANSDVVHFAQRQEADVIILGVTDVQANSVNVKLNVIDATTGNVITKHDYIVPMDSEMLRFVAMP